MLWCVKILAIWVVTSYSLYYASNFCVNLYRLFVRVNKAENQLANLMVSHNHLFLSSAITGERVDDIMAYMNCNCVKSKPRAKKR